MDDGKYSFVLFFFIPENTEKPHKKKEHQKEKTKDTAVPKGDNKDKHKKTSHQGK